MAVRGKRELSPSHVLRGRTFAGYRRWYPSAMERARPTNQFHGKHEVEEEIPQELIELLRGGRFIVEQPHTDTFPARISEKGFTSLDETGKEELRTLVEVCRLYYGGYLLTDPFGVDEEARRNWQTQMLKAFGKKYEEFQSRIKLRLANIQALTGTFNTFVALLDRASIHTPEAEKVRTLFDQLPKLEASMAPASSVPDALMKRLQEAFGQSELSADEAARVQAEIDKTYSMMDPEQKKDITHRIDSVAERFLTLVTTE